MLPFELPKKRRYLPHNFKVTVWSKLKPYFVELANRPIKSKKELEAWLLDLNELRAIAKDDFAFRAMQVMLDITNEKNFDAYQYATQELLPRVEAFTQPIYLKLLAAPFLNELDNEQYAIFLRKVKNEVSLFQKENLELSSEIEVQAQTYRALFSTFKIKYHKEQMSYSQALAMLETEDRVTRASIFALIGKQMAIKEEDLNSLYDKLLVQRHQLARNAGFDNFRSYQFKVLGRYDYGVKECEMFHDSIEAVILPIVEKMDQLRMEYLELEELHVYDLFSSLLPVHKSVAKQGAKAFLEKSIDCLNEIDPTFGESLKFINENQQLNLTAGSVQHHEGGCVPMLFSGVPFISMNVTGHFLAIETFMHQCGHGIHSMLAAHSDLNNSEQLPPELTKLSGRTIKYLSMKHWNSFINNEASQHVFAGQLWGLEQSMRQLLLVAAIDKFEHWLYTHPGHDRNMRDMVWQSINQQFRSKHLVIKGEDAYWNGRWQLISAMFIKPFDMFEYGIAEFGALEIWKNYLETPKSTLDQFIKAMQLGYSRTIPEVYAVAGTSFDFSRKRIKTLATFASTQFDQLLRQSGNS